MHDAFGFRPQVVSVCVGVVGQMGSRGLHLGHRGVVLLRLRGGVVRGHGGGIDAEGVAVDAVPRLSESLFVGLCEDGLDAAGESSEQVSFQVIKLLGHSVGLRL